MVPAKITDRFIAYLLDLTPLAVGIYGTMYVLALRLDRVPNTPAMWRRTIAAWFCFYILYQVLGNLSGATVGKRLLGIRVVGADGRPPGLGRSLVRGLGYLVSTPLFNLGFLWSLLDRDSRAWHDLLAGTRVVEARRRSAGAAALSACASFLVLTGILLGDAWVHLWRPTPLDRAAVLKAREGLQVLAAAEQSYRDRTGAYTDSLLELARESGDPGEFKKALEQIFDPAGFALEAAADRYVLRARALDARRTVVALEGPSR